MNFFFKHVFAKLFYGIILFNLVLIGAVAYYLVVTAQDFSEYCQGRTTAQCIGRFVHEVETGE